MICCVCKQPVYMVPEGPWPIVCAWDSPEFLIKNLDGRDLNEWGQKKLAWAKAVRAGEIQLS